MKKFLLSCFAVCLAIISAFTFTGCKDQDSFKLAAFGAFPPVSSVNANGKLVGLENDLGTYFANDMDKKFKYDIMSFDAMLAAVASGTHDAAFANILEDRKTLYDFTQPIFSNSDMLIAKFEDTLLDGKSLAEIKTALNGKRVGYYIGGVQGQLLSEIAGVTAVNYDSLSATVLALNNNQIDYFLAEFMITASGHIVKDAFFENSDLKIIEPPLLDGEVAFLVKKGNKKVLDSLNSTITRLKNDGTLDTMILGYLG